MLRSRERSVTTQFDLARLPFLKRICASPTDNRPAGSVNRSDSRDTTPTGSRTTANRRMPVQSVGAGTAGANHPSTANRSRRLVSLRSLAAAIPDDERLVVIEDTNELVLPHPHVVHLECVPARDGSGIGIADLVANALRMRPDRILVGEVRTPREASERIRPRQLAMDAPMLMIATGLAMRSFE